ncbi:MAG: SLC13/DASS family transporter, partial [Planctomycetes bacterium]|nr:SLC13/DASS family transporter [Planctomycetota bacterium]
SSLRRVVLGFMIATAFPSMWISNTASTLLMLPIGLAMIASLRDLLREPNSGPRPASLSPEEEEVAERVLRRLALAVMLGIAYSASIGGFTTLVGTPTNVQFLQIWSDQFPDAPEFSAGDWTTAVLPVGVLMLFGAWGLLVFRLPALPGGRSLDRSYFSEKLRGLGPPSRAEKLMLAVFSVTAVLWIFRTPLKFGHEPLFPGWGDAVGWGLVRLGMPPEMARHAVHDSTVAIGMALLMFFLPARRWPEGRVEYLMDWDTAKRLPWDILLLIGGGFALASAFKTTGLSIYIGEAFAKVVAGWPYWMLIASVCALMMVLTEFTSNVATISAILPILAGTAMTIHVDPRLIMVPATISTSCAFMLPVATPPNAIVFSSGSVTMGQMARYGVTLNLFGVLVITLATFYLFGPQMGIRLDAMPDWAAAAAAP